MNASLTNANLSNSNGDENGKTLVVTPSNQVRSTESDRPTGKRRESFFNVLMRCLSGVSF